jgi:hypothetical protein
MSGDIQIRERIEAWAQALRAKDLNALMAHYAPDIVTFDVMPLQSLGADAYRKNFEAWFASVQGPIDYEIRDLRITMRTQRPRGTSRYIRRLRRNAFPIGSAERIPTGWRQSRARA